jgi:quinol monooxygenase YgiN
MNVLSDKYVELSQTVASLSLSTGMEKGCRRCELCRSIEDENRFFLLEEGDTRGNIKNYLKSDNFSVIRGTMNLLKEPYEMMFHAVFYPAGMEKV